MTAKNELPSPDFITPWMRDTTIGWMDDVGGVRGRFWLRYTDPSGIYHWLNPETRQWVDEPGQVNMPTFKTYKDAADALLSAPMPKEAI